MSKKETNMRTLSIMAFASFLILWGIYSYLRDDTVAANKVTNTGTHGRHHLAANDPDSPVYQKKLRELDKIGSVINEKNVDIDSETKDQIKVAKKVFDVAQNLSEKQHLLEQSFMDRASSIKDIKRLQNEIVDIKNKLKTETTNTEKWDPKFVYYLMLQENYTYGEINNIKSLSENGLNPEEINYITELIKEDTFSDRITAFKGQGNVGRAVASLKKKPKEKDEFIDGAEVGESSESKLIEMNYNQEDKEEMVYGNNQ
ncbi:MAG: hypothetical protein H7281_08665 [Bacteriovorax sp.]|nr:hypothetical protein [Bacteriovorax sp.]